MHPISVRSFRARGAAETIELWRRREGVDLCTNASDYDERMIETPPLDAQIHYLVRFGRGIDGLHSVGAHADLVIWVDALPDAPATADGATQATTAAGAARTSNAKRTAPRAEDGLAHGWPEGVGTPIIHADLTTRTAAAKWMLDQQVEAGHRVSVAVVAASDGVEDTLAAGAVVDALAGLGIDFSSPEAAVVCASFTGLERAVGHLLSASIAGRALIAAGYADLVSGASGIDSAGSVVA